MLPAASMATERRLYVPSPSVVVSTGRLAPAATVPSGAQVVPPSLDASNRTEATPLSPSTPPPSSETPPCQNDPAAPGALRNALVGAVLSTRIDHDDEVVTFGLACCWVASRASTATVWKPGESAVVSSDSVELFDPGHGTGWV